MATVTRNLNLDLSGLDALKSLSQQRSATLKAVKAGAKLVQAAAKARAPKRAGKGGGGLKQSLGIKAVKGRRGKSLALAVIGARKKVERQIPRGRKTIKYVPGYTAHLVEGGTKPHAVRKGSRLGRRGKADAGQSGGLHPGARAKPFLGPAWDSVGKEAVAEAQRTLAAEIAKVLAKAAARLAAKAAKGK